MTSARFASIAQDLRERIALGEFGAGGAMDSEAELGQRYAVSRPTVRRALETLREEGLVEARHGAGWFVVGAAFHQPLALGTFRHAQSAVTEAGKTLQRDVVEFGFAPAAAATAAALAVPVGTSVLAVRSVRRVDGEGLDVVAEWVPGRLAGRLTRDDATTPGIWQTLTRLGARIASVRQTITAGLASPADAALLGTTAGAPLLLVRRVASGEDGIPLAVSDHRYLAARFALEVEFNSGPSAATPEPLGLRAVPNPRQEKTG